MDEPRRDEPRQDEPPLGAPEGEPPLARPGGGLRLLAAACRRRELDHRGPGGDDARPGSEELLGVIDRLDDLHDLHGLFGGEGRRG